MHVIYFSELFLCVEVTVAGVVVHAMAVGALSLSYTMIIRSDGFPHLWLGDFMAIGAYASLISVKVLGHSPYLGIPEAFILGGVIGVLFYRAVLKKLHDRGMGPVYMTLGSLGLGILVSAGAYCLAYWLRERFALYSMSVSLKEYDSSFLGVPTVVYVSLTLGAALLLSVIYLPKAPQGVIWRAFNEDTCLLQVCGCDPHRVRAWVWFVASGLTASLGSLYSLQHVATGSIGKTFMTVMALTCILGGETLTGSLLAGSLLSGFFTLFFGSLGQIHGDFYYSLRWAVQPILLWTLLWFKENIDRFFDGVL